MKKNIIFIIVSVILVGAIWFVYNTYFIAKDSNINGKLVVATDATYPPLEYVDNDGNMVGFDIDLIKAIAKELKKEVEIKNISFDNIFSDLEKGEVDVIISAVTITSERQKTMNFSAPYFNAGQIIVANKSSQITNQDDLKDKFVGVQNDTTSETEGEKYVDKGKLKIYKDYDVALENMKLGEIEAMIIDYPAGVSIVKSNDQLVKIVGKPFTSEFYGIAIAKDNQDLLSDINLVLAKLKKTGYLDKLSHTWFD